MPIQSVIAELNRLQAAGLVEGYAIGGAVAAIAYIELSDTEDIDVFALISGEIANSLAPLGAVWADLIAHGAVPDGGYLVIGEWPVQLLVPPAASLEADAVTHAQLRDFGGVQGRIMTPEYLAAIALATGRTKDYMRVVEFIRRGKINLAEFTTLLERHRLQAKWKTFQERFLTAHE